MTYSVKEVDLGRIYLDNNNPRHDPINNEAEIISHLIANEGVKPLARHIAKAGRTSPLERIAVVAHPKVKGAYVAAEGNRRVCAIKLLADPDKADTDANKKYFRHLAAEMQHPPTALEAVIFSSLAEARPWISLRHEGEQGGVGTKSWNPTQQARFNAQGESGSSNPNIQAYRLKEYASKKGLLSDKELDALSITTLTRFLSNPAFRAALGLVDNRTLNVSVPMQEFDNVVKRFLSDSLNENSGVNSRTNAQERVAYAEQLRAEGIAPSIRDLPVYDVTNEPKALVLNKKPPEKKQSFPRNNRSPDDRRTVIPKEFATHIHNKILKRLYDELRSLDAEEFSFAATYLLRAVIEQTATLFLQKRGNALEGELHKKLSRVVELLADDGMKDRELKVLRTMSNDRESRYSPDTLGHFVHGGAVPAHTGGIKLWDSIEPVMAVMFEELK